VSDAGMSGDGDQGEDADGEEDGGTEPCSLGCLLYALLAEENLVPCSAIKNKHALQ
jgi:hypothetical protein